MHDSTAANDAYDLLTPAQAGVLVRQSTQTLARKRVEGSGPAYLKLGGRVFYRRDDLLSWLDGCKRRSTSDRAT